MLESIPQGWGEDALTAFMDEARHHAMGVYFNLQREFADLQIVDSAFRRLIEGWMDPEQVHAPMFFIRAFSAFRAAAQLSISGQLTEAYNVTRSCLEHALYGNHIASTPGAWDVWINRGTDEKSRRQCAREFSPSKLFPSLRQREFRLGTMAGDLYERTIEFGAHPNEMAILSTMEMEETEDGGRRFHYSFLSGDGMPLRLCIKSVTQVGLVVLDMACLTFPRRCTVTRLPELTAPLKQRF